MASWPNGKLAKWPRTLVAVEKSDNQCFHLKKKVFDSKKKSFHSAAAVLPPDSAPA